MNHPSSSSFSISDSKDRDSADAPPLSKPDRPIPVFFQAFRYLLRLLRVGKARVQSLGKLHNGRNFMLGPGCKFLSSGYIRIGNNVSLGASVVVESNLSVGDNTLISSQVAFIGNDHDFSDPKSNVFSGKRLPASAATLEGDNLIGFRSIIVGSVRIGKGCIVGAGSVVTRDLPPYSICVGTPARKIRDRFPAGPV